MKWTIVDRTPLKTAIFAALALCALLGGCEDDQKSDDAPLTVTGTVAWKDLESGFYAIDGDDGQGYEPINLPAEFAVDGLRIRATAKPRNDMASINMYGILIEILSISRL